MPGIETSATFTLGERTRETARLRAPCRLPARTSSAPPRDHDAELPVLRGAVAAGVNHIDTSDYYGPHVTRLISEALHPIPTISSPSPKFGARRGDDASWNAAVSPAELTTVVHDNPPNLKLDVLDVVNFRSMHGHHVPAEGSIEAPPTVLGDLPRKGLIRHLGVSHVTPSMEDLRRRLRTEPLQARRHR